MSIKKQRVHKNVTAKIVTVNKKMFCSIIDV